MRVRQTGHSRVDARHRSAQPRHARWPHGASAAALGASMQTPHRTASSSARAVLAASARAALRSSSFAASSPAGGLGTRCAAHERRRRSMPCPQHNDTQGGGRRESLDRLLPEVQGAPLARRAVVPLHVAGRRRRAAIADGRVGPVARVRAEQLRRMKAGSGSRAATTAQALAPATVAAPLCSLASR